MAAKPAPDEGHRLRKEYERARERYLWAEGELRRQVQAEPGEDHNTLANYVREVRAEALEALRVLKSLEPESRKE